MSLTDGDVSSVNEEFINDDYCPYCHSGSLIRKMLEGPYSQKKAIAVGYWYRWDCKCKKCGKEWFGMDYYRYKDPDVRQTKVSNIDKAQFMKKPDSTRVIIASFVIGVIGSFTGGLLSYQLQFLVDYTVESEDFGFAIPGIISGFFICFLGSMWFLSMVWNRVDKDIHWVGLLFGAGAGALTASISIIFIDLTVRPGWYSTDWDGRLFAGFLFGIPGAFIGFTFALIITYFPGMMLLRFVKGQSSKSTKSDSAPTEKK